MQFCRLGRTVLLFTLFICLCRAGTPIVIAHRGSSGYRPENTIGSYDLGIEMGADFIEGDLVPTKDHVLVASHYPLISNTTDVADRPEFASRLVEKHVSGVNYTGFFVHDFTLAELKSLRARESHSWRDQSWNDVFSIPTLEEVLRFVRAKEKEKGRKIGIYLETKHPAYYRSIGLPLEEQLVDTLNRFGYEQEKSSVFIQSFETNLKLIKNISDYPLIQLVSGPVPNGSQFDTGRPWPNVTSLEGLTEIATYATGVGPHKTCILQRVKDEEGNFTSELRKTDFMDNARSLGLLVHVWTFQKDAAFYNEEEERRLFDSVEEELQVFYNLGIDGVFADHPDIAIRIRSKVLWTVPWTQIIAVLIAIALVIAPRFTSFHKVEASPELSPPKVRKISNSHSHTF